MNNNNELIRLNKNIAFISLGCDKNTVDAEYMLDKLLDYGFKIVDEIELAHIIIVNTCAFINDARQESIDAILHAVSHKTANCEKVFVTGCINELVIEECKSAIPDVDRFIRLGDNDNIVDIIESEYNINTKYEYSDIPPYRKLTTPRHYAYLKIADGCNNFCSYCTIPRIRGRYKSVPSNRLIKESEQFAKQGVKELILVAQDVTRYGVDFSEDKKPALVDLIKKISTIDGIERIRLHYCYPEMVTDELINEIKGNDKVCNYIDIPFQHINDKVLKEMNRKSSSKQIYDLLDKLRTESYISIRSTFMVGFPGETSREFKQLLAFLKQQKLNNVGFFKYSKERYTKASKMKKQIPELVKNYRLRTVQKVQGKIMRQKHESLLNTTCKVMCDSTVHSTTHDTIHSTLQNTHKHYYKGRTQYSSPLVDPVVYFTSDKKLKTGEIYKIKINKIMDYDLEGEKI